MTKIISGIKKYMLLQRLEMAAREVSDLCYIFLTTPYVTSGIINKKLRRLEYERNKAEIDADERRRMRTWLLKLEKGGFVERDGIVWKLTNIGRHELDRLRRRVGMRTAYQHPIPDSITIISFDIPEKMRGHRDWLRYVLKHLGFTMLHKSVWLGNIQLPKVFIEEIQFRRLTHYIEIMGITKQGTIIKKVL